MNKNYIIKLLLENKFAKRAIAKNYNLNYKMIDKYSDYKILYNRKEFKKFIEVVCYNKKIKFDIELIKKYKNESFYWQRLYINTLSLEELYLYKGEINWKYLCCSTDFNWTPEFLNKFKNVLENPSLRRDLVSNKSFPWTKELLLNFDKDLLCYFKGSHLLELNYEFIEEFEDRINWVLAAENEEIPWNWNLIRKYEDRIFKSYHFSENEKIKWTIEEMDYYTSIEKYTNNLWHTGGYGGFSYNGSLDWSIKFIEYYYKRWNWYDIGISENDGIPWDLEMLSRFEDNIDFYLLSYCKSVKWTIQLIDKFIDRWSWSDIATNKFFPWNIELFEKYKENIEKYEYYICYDNFWDIIIKPYIDDEVVDIIMSKEYK